MRIGRYSDGTDAFWVVVDADGLYVHALHGPLAEWVGWISTGEGAGGLSFGPRYRLDELRVLAPVSPEGRIFGVGSTYRRHVTQLKHVLGTGTDEEFPQTPGGFIKPHSAVVHPDDEIHYPMTTSQLDFEVELVVVFGGSVSDAAHPMEAVLGYTIGNDISARDAKTRHGGPDYFSMKCLDRTAPIGPWIVTRDELGGDDHPDVRLRLSVNGEVRQEDRTTSMAWTIAELITYVNDRIAVHAGDLLFTGTTAGVGWEDGRFLQPGDEVEALIEGIGALRSTVGKRFDGA